MKIEIEFNSSYEAKITCDGKEMTYGLIRGGVWQLRGITNDESENTVGGMVVGKLTENMINILQAWLPNEESPDGDCWETWEKLTDSAAEEIYERIH
jgi:hypothetical protein